MSKTSKPMAIRMPSPAEDRLIREAAAADPDANSLTTAQLKAMVPLRSIAGRPKSDNKKLLVSLRYSPEVIAYFKSTGDGWQSRMDGVLREYVARQSSAD